MPNLFSNLYMNEDEEETQNLKRKAEKKLREITLLKNKKVYSKSEEDKILQEHYWKTILLNITKECCFKTNNEKQKKKEFRKEMFEKREKERYEQEDAAYKQKLQKEKERYEQYAYKQKLQKEKEPSFKLSSYQIIFDEYDRMYKQGKSPYHTLCLKYHPDKNREDTTHLFQLLANIHENYKL
jgi:hypothetical protein